MKITPIVVQRRGHGAYQLRHGRFTLAAVFRNRPAPVTRALSLARVLRVGVHYQERAGAAAGVLAGR